MLHIHSEHAIGFLKGRFHSLKHLRVRIKDAKSHKFATYWVAASIGLHAFVICCEAEESDQDEFNLHMQERFINEGLSSSSNSDNPWQAGLEWMSVGRLRRAKKFHEKLKGCLFRAIDDVHTQ